MHRIAIVVGSLREGSLNRKIAKAICALSSDMLDCFIVEIGQLPHYNQDNEKESTISARKRQLHNFRIDRRP